MINLHILKQGSKMKLLLALIIASATLFAGGDIRPDRVVHRKAVAHQKPVVHQHCYKPNIKKCPDCEDVAELCPYNGEDLPIAETSVCQGLIRQQQAQQANH
jgi:hypothetical protein